MCNCLPERGWYTGFSHRIQAKAPEPNTNKSAYMYCTWAGEQERIGDSERADRIYLPSGYLDPDRRTSELQSPSRLFEIYLPRGLYDYSHLRRRVMYTVYSNTRERPKYFSWWILPGLMCHQAVFLCRTSYQLSCLDGYRGLGSWGVCMCVYMCVCKH